MLLNFLLDSIALSIQKYSSHNKFYMDYEARVGEYDEDNIFQHEKSLVTGRVSKQDVYFLAAVILVRIYKEDKPKWTTVDLKQWIRYMQYAGIEHIYLYDNYKYSHESLESWCASHFSRAELTYHDWSMYMPYTIEGTQVRAYQHAVDSYKNVSKWHIAFDMDEYPFPLVDKHEDFLKRYLLNQLTQEPRLHELSFRNYLFLGKPTNRTYVIERMLRRTPKYNRLVKPLYKPECVKSTAVHRNYYHYNKTGCGRHIIANEKQIRLNHYWGARLQNWGEDTPEKLNKTIFDDSALQIVDLLDEYIKSVDMHNKYN